MDAEYVDVSDLAAWTLRSHVLEVREQATVSASDDAMRQLSAGAVEAFGITVSRKPGDENWTIRTSDVVGVVQLDSDQGPRHLRILPKIDTMDLFFLADWAYGISQDVKTPPHERARLDALRTDPAACLLGWYISQVRNFAERWIRRGYVDREEDLSSRIRGRIVLPRYLNRSVAQAQAQIIPCRFSEPSHDTPANRFLKAGLRRAAILSASIPIAAARRALRESIRQALSLFTGVSDVNLTARSAHSLNLFGPMRHYRPLVQLTASMMASTYLSTDIGPHVQQAFAWPLNRMYEEALRGVLKEWPGGNIASGRGRVAVELSDGRIIGASPVIPDFVATRSDGALVVLDAKYKDVWRASTVTPVVEGDSVDVSAPNGYKVRVRRADIYQVVAYSQHENWRGAVAGLVYPISLSHSDSYPNPAVIKNFDPDVYIIFFDVGPSAGMNIQHFYSALDTILAGSEPVRRRLD